MDKVGIYWEDLRKKVEEWMNYDKNEKTRTEIQSLVDRKDYGTLNSLMMKRLMFGTAGLRGRMGAGYACMNDLVIVQTSQGLGRYLLSVCPEANKKGIVIGYDSRHNSHRFAKLAAAAFIGCGIPVYFFGKIVPTPFVPFCVMQKKAAAGVMVTASHNPKEDNGYKVYWTNGAQIIPPHDSGIQSAIEDNLVPWHTAWDVDQISSMVCDPLEEIHRNYYKILASSMLNSASHGESPTFVHTSMHGVAHDYMVDAFKACNFKPFIPVKEQMVPDPEFPTVKFPNPEEGKSALDLSINTANANNSAIILANDPDADRLAIAEKLPGGSWKVFTGNEEGALLGWWAWHRCINLTPDLNREDVYMISSTVSSKILQAIAKKEGFKFKETLTGFKWMGNLAHQLLTEGKTVLFAFEEAIGYMNGSVVLDKDGISAAMRIAEMATYLQKIGMTLNEKLEDIYKTYGYHCNYNSYYLCYDPDTVKTMFERMRNFNGPQTYPTSVCDGKFHVKSISDLTTGYDSATEDNKTVLPPSSSSQMIIFNFENGTSVTLRTSGTEPKIKYYSEMAASPDSKDWDKLRSDLEELVKGLVEELMEPSKNNLSPPPT